MKNQEIGHKASVAYLEGPNLFHVVVYDGKDILLSRDEALKLAEFIGSILESNQPGQVIRR